MTALEWCADGQWLRVEPWGQDSVRVRVAPGRPVQDDLPGALLPPAADAPPEAGAVQVNEGRCRLRNGRLTVELDRAQGGRLRFVDSAGGSELLAEEARELAPAGAGLWRIQSSFRANDGERLYGLGQHQHGRLNQKGLTLELRQRNMHVSIPFLLSNRGYGLLWNNPALGRVELGDQATRWTADGAPQLDYWVTAGAPRDILARYADATGHAPPLPAWAAGLWQSRLRYASQDELLAVAREYHRRGLPLAVLVIDALHWTVMGDWQFDPAAWPDPAAMVRELDAMGVRVMVSVWPTVNPHSVNLDALRQGGWLLRDRAGQPARSRFIDRQPAGPLDLYLLDATHPDARAFFWQRLHEGYYRHGIKLFWLDADEPEMDPLRPEHLRYAAGEGAAVANLYPERHARAVYEGLRAAGESEIITLNRSAWAGSQRWGAAVWSGDIEPTWEALRAQIPAGLNAGLSGIPWWTTDIGGFQGGAPESEEYRELLVRWFEFGVFCPLLRMHGYREPRRQWVGGPNELWSYGERAYAILREQLALRERLRPTILAAMQEAHETGLPPMRPLWVDFGADPLAWQVEDAYLFGADLLVAPVTEAGAASREVYLPAGCGWAEWYGGQMHAGGQWVRAAAPLERIPVFRRVGVSARP